MRDDTETLVAEWMEMFGEPPPVAEAELMEAVLADYRTPREPTT